MVNTSGLFFRLNEYYNRHCEQTIANSLLAAGGIKAYFVRHKLKKWLQITQGTLLDIGSGDEKWRTYIHENTSYITLDYVHAASSCPWRHSKPDINGDGLALPVSDKSVDAVLNAYVIEHVRDPRRLIEEISRILKPGGVFLLVGPGDITISHGEPYVFFNMTKYAYRMLLEENHFEILEEYVPSRTFVSLAQLAYFRLVRNKAYNRNSILKGMQIPIFLLSLVLSPFINIFAWLLDIIIPFDGRGYDLYMVRSRKRAL